MSEREKEVDEKDEEKRKIEIGWTCDFHRGYSFKHLITVIDLLKFK